jgi:hypothetical protein
MSLPTIYDNQFDDVYCLAEVTLPRSDASVPGMHNVYNASRRLLLVSN